MIVADLDHELRLHRYPLAGAFGRPAARTARRVAGEASAFELLQLRGERGLVGARDRRREAHVIEQAGAVIETEQQRADKLAVRPIAKPADDAICAAIILDFHHRVARVGTIGAVAPLRDDSVERGADLSEPTFRVGESCRRGREPDGSFEVSLRKGFELWPTLAQG